MNAATFKCPGWNRHCINRVERENHWCEECKRLKQEAAAAWNGYLGRD